MPNFQQIARHVLSKGKVDEDELRMLRQVLYADGKIDRREIDFLVDLHNQLPNRTPAFEQFFYQALKDHLLDDGRLSAYKADWLRQILFADGKITNDERVFLRQLKWDAKEVSPEFEALYKEAMKSRPTQRIART
jgi:uncharacterized tellurite resistance protein B-like protein